MSSHRFNIFGNIIVVESTKNGWLCFEAGSDGKRRRADFEVPSFVSEAELCEFLADLLHESATPRNPDAYRIVSMKNSRYASSEMLSSWALNVSHSVTVNAPVAATQGRFVKLRSNKCIERTAGKRCLPVRFGLRPTPAAHAQR